MKGGAYLKLAEELFTESFDLQVLPRVRFSARLSLNTTAGGAVDTINLTIAAPVVNLLGPRDGVLFERSWMFYQPTNPTTLLLRMAYGPSTLPIGFIASGNSVADTDTATFSAAAVGNQNFVVEFPVKPRLWTAQDLGITGNFPVAVKPSWTGALIDDGAASQLVNITFNAWLRIVRGLQEL